MTYLCGFISTDEKKELEKRRGIFFEKEIPKELLPKESLPEQEFVMIWLNVKLFDTMNAIDKEDLNSFHNRWSVRYG